MPTYEYECTQCGKTFEYFQSIKEKPKTKCEACGGKLKKLISAGAGLVFKGTGFYITDYKKKSVSPTESKPETKHEKKSETISSTTTTETKTPEKPTETKEKS